ncbi:MAG: tryptophan--tRNA ligase [Acidobacteriota bacterium]|nr:tryptophan--tRNA ligase [Blastocatellia bacterium]MDW8413753.1 tryptophan--tRNA ligase [Acidobacteriota bacterium]
MKRILSGIQPTSKIHLGNYFGAIKQHIELQEQGECFYFVANYHALTSVNDPKTLRENTLDIALDYLALGLDPEKACLFRQSDVPEVTELTWLLSTVTGMGLLERAHSFKDKVAKGITPNVGLFTYPILMAADILIYQSDLVPVGSDQLQHIEMAQDIAGYFNNTYGYVFKRPEALLSPTPKVPGTDGQKMSKSYHNTIPVFAEDSALRKAVMSIVTDSLPLEAPKDPDCNTVYRLYELFASADEIAEMRNRFLSGGYGYGQAKRALLEKIDAYFAPARARRKELASNLDYVEQVLRQGAQKARHEAALTLKATRLACGLDT